MCIICIDFDRRAMNVSEARRALGEMGTKLDKKHLAEVEAKLDAAAPEDATAATSPKTP